MSLTSTRLIILCPFGQAYCSLSPVHKFSLTSFSHQGKVARVYGATCQVSLLLESWRASFSTSLTSENLVCVHTGESRRQARREKNLSRKTCPCVRDLTLLQERKASHSDYYTRNRIGIKKNRKSLRYIRNFLCGVLLHYHGKLGHEN